VEDVLEGRKIYLTYGCVACHGVTGGGGMGKPILDDQWIFGSDDATLFKLIRGDVPKQTMPSAIGKALTDDQIKKVILYVRSVYKGDASKITWQVPPPVPEELLRAPVNVGDPIAAGKVLFLAACVPCHGAAGKGDGPGSVQLNPKPRNLTDAAYMLKLDDRYLYELISRGGVAVGKSSQMPEFPLSPQDIQNVIAFVRTLPNGSGAVVNASTGEPHG
jgi:mono/diheme cytochrome c family protein